MQNEIEKYLPKDITNIILNLHYKSMFNGVLNSLDELIDAYNKEIMELFDGDDPDIFMHKTGNCFAWEIIDDMKATKYLNNRPEYDEDDYAEH
jgi:hypothetical protein